MIKMNCVICNKACVGNKIVCSKEHEDFLREREKIFLYDLFVKMRVAERNGNFELYSKYKKEYDLIEKSI